MSAPPDYAGLIARLRDYEPRNDDPFMLCSEAADALEAAQADAERYHAWRDEVITRKRFHREHPNTPDPFAPWFDAMHNANVESEIDAALDILIADTAIDRARGET